jgi:hypothetical protein
VDGLALVAGIALGGTVGIGTALLAGGVAPLMAFFHRRLTWLRPAGAVERVGGDRPGTP